MIIVQLVEDPLKLITHQARDEYSNRAENFKWPKNREDSSDPDEKLTNRSQRLKLSFEKKFHATRLGKQRFRVFFARAAV